MYKVFQKRRKLYGTGTEMICQDYHFTYQVEAISGYPNICPTTDDIFCVTKEEYDAVLKAVTQWRIDNWSDEDSEATKAVYGKYWKNCVYDIAIACAEQLLLEDPRYFFTGVPSLSYSQYDPQVSGYVY